MCITSSNYNYTLDADYSKYGVTLDSSSGIISLNKTSSIASFKISVKVKLVYNVGSLSDIISNPISIQVTNEVVCGYSQISNPEVPPTLIQKFEAIENTQNIVRFVFT